MPTCSPAQPAVTRLNSASITRVQAHLGGTAEFGKNRTTRASPLSASAIAIVFCIAALLRVPDRRKKVKDCGTTNGHIELMARTLMKDAREDLVR